MADSREIHGQGRRRLGSARAGGESVRIAVAADGFERGESVVDVLHRVDMQTVRDVADDLIAVRRGSQEPVSAGADWFLAPASNCDEVVGNIPDGLQVYSVEDLDDALAALEAISGGGDGDALPTCTR